MAQVQRDTPMIRQPRLPALECPRCEIPLTLLESVWNGRANGYVRVFECGNCHKLTWDE